MKLYYDCPIEVLYMRKRFNVPYYMKNNFNGYIVPKKAHHIFEPKVGDVIQYFEGKHYLMTKLEDDCFTEDLMSTYTPEWYFNDFKNDIFPFVKLNTIIQRDGKPFFMPKVED